MNPNEIKLRKLIREELKKQLVEKNLFDSVDSAFDSAKNFASSILEVGKYARQVGKALNFYNFINPNPNKEPRWKTSKTPNGNYLFYEIPIVIEDSVEQQKISDINNSIISLSNDTATLFHLDGADWVVRVKPKHNKHYLAFI